MNGSWDSAQALFNIPSFEEKCLLAGSLHMSPRNEPWKCPLPVSALSIVSGCKWYPAGCLHRWLPDMVHWTLPGAPHSLYHLPCYLINWPCGTLDIILQRWRYLQYSLSLRLWCKVERECEPIEVGTENSSLKGSKPMIRCPKSNNHLTDNSHSPDLYVIVPGQLLWNTRTKYWFGMTDNLSCMTLNPFAYQNEHYNAPILLHLGMYILLLAHLLVTETIWYDYHQMLPPVPTLWGYQGPLLMTGPGWSGPVTSDTGFE